MLKFLRKYQKWMLAVFCVGLMIAFLIPQAASQFSPEPAKRTVARTADGTAIKQQDLADADRDLRAIRRLQLDPFSLPGVALLPTEGDSGEQALQWVLIQHVADMNKLGASNNEVFTLLANALGVQNDEELKAKAQELDMPVGYLFDIGEQYLKAEQVRQLVLGVEYTAPSADQTGSPGLRRLDATAPAYRSFTAALSDQQTMQMLTQVAMMRGARTEADVNNFILDQVLVQPGHYAKIVGHGRITADELRYTLQRQLARLDLTIVVLDAESRTAGVSVTDEQVRALFEQYADTDPGRGEPFPLGYREPDRVKLEAIRIPIEQVRGWALGQVTSEDVRSFYDDEKYNWQFDESFGTPAEDTPAPRRQITPEQRDQIELTLAQQRAQERVQEIADRAQSLLAEDARGLKSERGFKVLPAGFTPTPMDEVAGAIASEFGIDPEVIRIDSWVSSGEIREQAAFTQALLGQAPYSTVRLPNPDLFGMLTDAPVSEAVLSGRAGLFATVAPAPLADYLGFAQPFAGDNPQAAQVGLQVGLPSRVMVDLTGSMYVFRITQAQPAHKAGDLASVAGEVREDAVKVAAYEQLVSERDALLQRATSSGVESIAPGGDAIRPLEDISRQLLTFEGRLPLAQLNDARPIVDAAFELADELSAAGSVDNAPSEKRLLAVPLPGDFKLAIVRIDKYEPLSRPDFERAALSPNTIENVLRQERPADAENPLSLEALQRYTGFKWADGEGPSESDDESSGEEAQPSS